MYLFEDIRYEHSGETKSVKKRWVCPDCFKDELDRLPLDELADMLGFEYRPVERMSG